MRSTLNKVVQTENRSCNNEMSLQVEAEPLIGVSQSWEIK